MTERDIETGRFLPGNRFWEVRSSHGRNPIFASPDDLLQAATEYFQWVEDTPLYEDRLVTFQGSASYEPVAKMRAMTIDGLCIFLDIARQTWSDYRERPDFLAVTARVEQVIRSQKFTGAAADLLNANIIARDLGLADKSEITAQVSYEISDKPLSEEWKKSMGRLRQARLPSPCPASRFLRGGAKPVEARSIRLPEVD